MNLKVLILHQTLRHTDEILADYRLYMAEPHIVHTLDEALARLTRYQYSIVVVEVTPPWKYAAEPIVAIRAVTNTPILALLRGRNIDHFKCCREIANDCVMEPFTSEEIIARGLALVEHCVFDRISPSTAMRSIYCNGLLLAVDVRKVYYLDNEIRLARKEYAILKLLAEHKNHVLSKEQIYTRVWHDDFVENVDGVVSYQIHNLRKRLAEYSEIEYIENVWGEGYRFGEGNVSRMQKCI